mmetsp:Transcript_26726/g.36814  ORF Transcript_26726/g.36814 Transcript_26726/m.36814 type:complete len:268 (-) Transcript_26726:169-972(-)
MMTRSITVLLLACVAILSAVHSEEEIALNIDFEKIHSKVIANIESHLLSSSNHLEGTVTTQGNYIGYKYYSKSGKKCQSSTLASMSYSKVTGCTAVVNGSVITGYYKTSCTIGDSFTAGYFPNTDTTCTGLPNYAYSVKLDTCPADAKSPVYDCATGSSLQSKFKSIKGVVAQLYSNSKGCQTANVSTLNSVYYSPTLYSFNENNLYTCAKTYALVCDGTTGIQQLKYSKTNCKGTSKKVNSLTLPVCQGGESSNYVTYACSGPSKL